MTVFNYFFSLFLFIPHFPYCAEEDVGFVEGEGEWREEADHVLAGYSGEDMVGEEEVLPDLGNRYVVVHAYHESTPTDFPYVCGQGDVLHQILADLLGIVHEMGLADDVDYCYGCCHGEVVASEGGAEHAFLCPELGGDEDSSHGYAVSHSLGGGDDVGTDAVPLMGEEAAGAAVSALHLVEDEDYMVLTAQALESLHELSVGDVDASAALDAFDDDGCHVAPEDFLLYLVEVVEGAEGHLVGAVKG